MVKQLADQLVSKKFRNVKADHPDFSEKPALITQDRHPSGQIPDVTATGIQLVLFEVETDDTIHDPHTKDQWELFASHAERHSADFWIVVPKSRLGDARERVSTLGLKAKVMGI
jgi:hypothetical protein